MITQAMFDECIFRVAIGIRLINEQFKGEEAHIHIEKWCSVLSSNIGFPLAQVITLGTKTSKNLTANFADTKEKKLSVVKVTHALIDLDILKEPD